MALAFYLAARLRASDAADLSPVRYSLAAFLAGELACAINYTIADSASDMMSEQYQDHQRMDHCTTCNVLKDGQLAPACVFQHPDTRRHPLPRKNLGMRMP